MKKWMICVWLGALCLGLLLYSCIDGPPAQPDIIQEQTDGAAQEKPEESDVPDEPEDSKPLMLYILDEDASTAAAWEQIALKYEELTGVQILLSDGSESQQPAIVVQSTPPGAELCADLSASTAYAQLISWDLAVRGEGKVCAIATQMECYGLLCNTQLLANPYAYGLSEINSLEKLKEVAEHIGTTGGVAFAAPELDLLAAWFAMLPEDGYAFARLYLRYMGDQSSATNPAAQQLHEDKAVFCLGSTEDCTHTESGQMGILPVYLGRGNEQNQTLCAVGSRYLSVRSDITQEQQAAALAFLDYLVMPEADGTVPLDILQRLSPFRQATYAGNALEQMVRSDLAAGKECLVCTPSLEIGETMLQALQAFVAEPTYENWQSFLALR